MKTLKELENILGENLILMLDSQEIAEMKQYYNIQDDSITGFVCTINEGDMYNVYASESCAPYALCAIYHPIAYYQN
jgi:hypothetical protein